jgi:glycosyltransferase involved in cell wall biosynthesis
MSQPDSLPSVSIVVPVKDGWESTFRCLLAVAQNSGGVRRETIVVDNGSSDDTRAALPLLEGIRLIRNERDAGFAAACNQAAAVAQGDALVLLDRDAVPGTGWLPPLARLFADGSAAAACPADASGLSGAFLAVRTSAYREAGGLDESRPDAADALLARLLEAGKRVEVVDRPALTLPGEAPAARPDFTVVVPVFDAAATVGRCLESLARNLGPGDELVVADGGSGDDTLRIAYELAARHPRQVRVLASRPPGGLPAAAREGLQAASRPMAAVVQATVEAPAGFLDGLVGVLARNPGNQALAIEVPGAGLCAAGPSELLRAVGTAGPEALFQTDGVALGREVTRAGARLAYLPAR